MVSRCRFTNFEIDIELGFESYFQDLRQGWKITNLYFSCFKTWINLATLYRLTHNTPLIRTPNWIWMKFVAYSFIHYMYIHHKKYFWNSSMRKAFFRPPLFSKTKLRQPTGQTWKRPRAWRNFKNIFSRPLFTIIFRPKILILDTYSILST